MVMFASCLSRFAVQRPRPGRSGWAGVSWPAAAARASGRQLLLPAPVWPAHVHHPQALQQKDSHKRQEQRARGGQSCLPVSYLHLYSHLLVNNRDGLNLMLMLNLHNIIQVVK